MYTYKGILIETHIVIPMNMKIIMCQRQTYCKQGEYKYVINYGFYHTFIWYYGMDLITCFISMLAHMCFFMDYSQVYIHVHACSNHLGVFLFITRDLSFHFICKKKTNRKRQATLLISKLWFSGYCFVVINFVIYTILNG